MSFGLKSATYLLMSTFTEAQIFKKNLQHCILNQVFNFCFFYSTVIFPSTIVTNNKRCEPLMKLYKFFQSFRNLVFVIDFMLPHGPGCQALKAHLHLSFE